MKSLILSTLLLPALALANEQQITLTTSIRPTTAAATANLALTTESAPTPVLELRQLDVTAATTLDTAVAAPVATTNWEETTINGVTTYVPVAYTQTFASVPDQLATAGAGTVGMGTITGEVGVVKTSEADKSSAASSSGVSSNHGFVVVGVSLVGVLAGMTLL